MKTEEKLNLTMLCDFYELTMGNGYFRAGLQDRITYFDVFFRNVPDNGGFAVCAGLEQLVQYIQNLHFDEEDIAFLSESAFADACCPGNPRDTSVEEIKALYKKLL